MAQRQATLKMITADYCGGAATPSVSTRRPIHAPPRDPSPTVAEFAEEWLEAGRAERQKPSTIENKEILLRNHLVPLLGKLRLDEILVRGREGTPKSNRKRTLPLSPRLTENRRQSPMIASIALDDPV